MCWVGKFDLKRAEEDIVCYKMCDFTNEELKAYYRLCPYKLGNKYEYQIEPFLEYFLRSDWKTFISPEQVLGILGVGDCSIQGDYTVKIYGRWYHSYTKDVHVVEYSPRTIYSSNQCGILHGITTLDVVHGDCAWVECIIPKGTLYMENGQEIVSKAIILNKIIQRYE